MTLVPFCPLRQQRPRSMESPHRVVAGPGWGALPPLPSRGSPPALSWREVLSASVLPQWPLQHTHKDGPPPEASSPSPTPSSAFSLTAASALVSPAQAPPPSMPAGLSPGPGQLQLQEIRTSPDHNFLFGGHRSQRKPPPHSELEMGISVPEHPISRLQIFRSPPTPHGLPVLLQVRSDGTSE